MERQALVFVMERETKNTGLSSVGCLLQVVDSSSAGRTSQLLQYEQVHRLGTKS